MFGKRRGKKDLTNLSIYTAFHHVSGLPIVEECLCEVFSFPDRLDFKYGTTEITLSKSKITDMTIKTDTEIQTQAVSSVGGAVSGAILFGALGAVIGGRTKNKKVKSTTDYLIITYCGDAKDDLKFIVFDTKNNPPSAHKLIKEFQNNSNLSNIKITL